jgi:protein-disulfide isomerase
VTTPPTPSRVPAGATPEGDGIVLGDGPVRVDAFIDFLCPYCRRFELSSGPALSTMLAEHRINLVYHPMNFLDQASTTHYSTRRFLEYAHQLFVNQPPEGSAGLSESELAALAGEIGLAAEPFASRLGDGLYLDWPPYVTARAADAGVSATPTVLVAGVQIAAESRAIARAVAEVSV